MAILFIDSDDIEGLSEALADAMKRRGIYFTGREKPERPFMDAPMPSGCGTSTYGSSCGITIPHNSCGYDGFSSHCGGWGC